jgi:hypothetical protein
MMRPLARLFPTDYSLAQPAPSADGVYFTRMNEYFIPL